MSKNTAWINDGGRDVAVFDDINEAILSLPGMARALRKPMRLKPSVEAVITVPLPKGVYVEGNRTFVCRP